MELIKYIHPKNSFTLCLLYSVFIYYKVLSFKIFLAVSESKKDRFHHLHIGNKDFPTQRCDLLAQGQPAPLQSGWPSSVLLTPSLGLFVLYHILTRMKIVTLRPVIDMRVRCGEWDQPPDCHHSSLTTPDALISHSGLRTFETQRNAVQLHPFDVFGPDPLRQSGIALSFTQLMAFPEGYQTYLLRWH